MNFIQKLFKKKPQGSAYDYAFTNLKTAESFPLSQYKGKVILIVNTASKCGFTAQYQGLEQLYQTYKDKGLVIIGVPSNDFAKQEPGSSADIAQFCEINYGVSFPMTAKEKVIGKDAHPFYHWVKENLGFIAAPKWNFHKILIDKKGEIVDYFYSTTKPDATSLTKAIEHQVKVQI